MPERAEMRRQSVAIGLVSIFHDCGDAPGAVLRVEDYGVIRKKFCRETYVGAMSS